ncbi:MAG: AbrB/MazE/SpoVT family DNA-binding domain-containing protein [Thermoanaerobaculia bacterium]
MVSTIQKWGNSLAVRIPKAFAAQAQLDQDSNVEISLEGDRIVISATRREWTLDALLGKITSVNLHHENDWGGRAGSESW